jgi:hypothetical protein
MEGEILNSLPESRCLHCGTTLNAVTSIEPDKRPEPGDITVCLRCGHIMAFATDLTLRALTDEEMYKIAGDERMLQVQRMLAEINAEREP